MFKIIGKIDSDLIENAENNVIKKRKFKYSRYIAVAACMALIIGISVILVSKKELPVITLDSILGEGYGPGESHLAYSIDEIVNENPWNINSNIKHLPVIKNPLTFSIYGVENPDFEAMKLLLKNTADKLGMDVENLPIKDNTPDERRKQQAIEQFKGIEDVPEEFLKPSCVFMQDEKYRVEVDKSMDVTVSFEPAVVLPEGYNFTYNASYQDLYKVAEYLLNEYKDYIGMKNPKINISGGDYNFYGEKGYEIQIFDDTGDLAQKIINYNFNYVTFYCNKEGELDFSRYFKPNLDNVIGYYPIISKEKAFELLENKNYITSVCYDFPGTEYVKKIEIVYPNADSVKIFMPYYRILVQIPVDVIGIDENLNNYGAYYVPAVDGKYIENLPVWDGEFNK